MKINMKNTFEVHCYKHSNTASVERIASNIDY